MGMTNKTRHSLFNSGAALPGGRYKARLRIYTLGAGADAQVLFSLRLWQAATLRQGRLAETAQA
ncbi:MAG: hypothetical protein A2234_01745 [Elusimicrobia bacterium RIFOXYA2_FULL_58_8]|nr:MAG: hypothetical protein A2285_01555 [Elusimicrobia bacterium RIFOXYA12_FULL_57_11]OGS12309.1 MAG: hypothetical protein A2234_01745 [Elusimicrobia bacterium RIFOXYA2_FULL_58_8]